MRRRSAALASLPILLGGALLLVSLLLTWYTYSSSQSYTESNAGTPVAFSSSATYRFAPGMNYEVSESSSCSGAPQCGNTSRLDSSVGYGATGFDHTGALYESIEAGVIFAGLAGLLSAILLVLPAARSTLRLGALVLALLAMLLAFAGPLALGLGQSGDLRADSPPGGSPASPGPAFTFVGTSSQEGVNASWGPSTGWFLSIAAGGLIAVGLALEALTAAWSASEPNASPDGARSAPADRSPGEEGGGPEAGPPSPGR